MMRGPRTSLSVLLPVVLSVLLLATSTCHCLNSQEDDLVFDDVGEETPTLSSAESEVPTTVQQQQQHQPALINKPNGARKWQRVERLLGMPDAVATVGRVFKLHVPKQAFAGSVDYYEARGSGGKGLSHWLRWDEPAAALYGVASRKDVGRHRVSIKAFGKHGEVAQDSFTIHVVPERREHYQHNDGRKRCAEDQDRTLLTILIDARYENLKPGAKVNALENLAGFLGLHTSSLSIQPEANKENTGNPFNGGSSVVLSGPGNVGRRREKHSTLVQWQVGCDGHFWPHQIDTIKQIPDQASDGTLTEVMQLPVYQWRVRSEPSEIGRDRREAVAAASGDGLLPDDEDEYDSADYEDEDEENAEDYDSNEGITESPTQEPRPRKPLGPAGPAPELDEHPHRHHHGEDSIAGIAGIGAGLNPSEEDVFWRNAEINNAIFNATPSSTTSGSPTIAVTLSPSTTTTPTTTTTITTSTSSSSNTEQPTESSSTTSATESTTSTSTTTTTTTTTTMTTTTTTTTESAANSTSEANTTTTSTTASPAAITPNDTIDSLTTKTGNATPTYTNLTISGWSSQLPSNNNASIDSLNVENEDNLTTDRDIDNETDSDLTTTLQSNLFTGSESTTGTSSSGGVSGSGSSTPTAGSFAEGLATGEPSFTSIIVNGITEEYTEASGAAKEASSPSSATSFVTSSSTATEKVSGEPLDPYGSFNVPVFSFAPNSTTTSTTTETATFTPESTTPSTTSTTTTTTEPTTTTTTTTSTMTTTTEGTTTSTTPSTTTSTTTTTTEKIEYAIRNLPPKVERRLKKLPITQGKVLSFVIPEDTFSDPEEGNTRNLRLRLHEKEAPIKPTYWLQFNEDTQEVYGLPLEDQYGSYTFEVIATDSEGETASDKLEIVVQQHKQIRAVNHEFHIYLKIEKRSEFPTNVDWELKVMRSLAELYREDLSHITVRSIDIDHDQAIYTWTNDSLARSSICPQEEINRIYRTLVTDEKTEEPSQDLVRVLGPEIRPKRVVYQGLEQCQQSKETQVNKYPVPRNQIDQLNATVGQLFVYRVPKDTFFDEEDGDTPSMKASLLTANRTEIPPRDWLQFDSSNQEFYGVPLKQDIGRKTYQLVVKDREGLEATDSLVAEVHPSPLMRHVVEISMALNMPYETFAHSALKKREFIQKLQKLYGDKNASAISLLSISGNRDTTTVTWRNLTLPTYECPHEEITRLRRVLVNDNKSFTEELNREFNSISHQPEFAVIQITVSQMGACQDLGLGGGAEMPPVDDSTSIGASHDDYLITFVLPAIIIAAMLVLAGIIACILYKRRRSGKMSVSEKDDERQSFRSKGIPVIFQDELDEKPDPGNKSPIILKEEKPPLPPPEYQRAEDGADIPMLSKENSEEPYQPPPPFATSRDSSRQNRPKPTPTYRKPPPYVPP